MILKNIFQRKIQEKIRFPTKQDSIKRKAKPLFSSNFEDLNHRGSTFIPLRHIKHIVSVAGSAIDTRLDTEISRNFLSTERKKKD